MKHQLGIKIAAATILAAASTSALAVQCPAIPLGEHYPAAPGKDMRTADTQPWCDPVCVNQLTNGTSCNNAAGDVVTTFGFCNDAENARESIVDIQYNLCIEVDQEFIDLSGYTGQPPSVDFKIPAADAAFYFAALFAEDTNGNGIIDGDEVTLAKNRGWALANELNPSGSGMLTRNEASAVKGEDPCQLLSTGFASGLATDDILSYIGLYIGEPMVDKYAGDLEEHVKVNLEYFSRTWQPSYWANDAGDAIADNPGGVTDHYNKEYGEGGGYRVCDAEYNGRLVHLYAAMRDGTGSGDNGGGTGGDNGGDNGGGSGGDNGGGDGYPISPECPSSHPHMCSSLNQCFTEAQMDSYCN
ncbi:hypothetical protein [Aliagarivorans marinus]|uniref:hypothetical protein n=1 Tax=Aliagarivorans marinus TaxID=561965 RepID=UPI00047D49C5|nr:hypothetical protein [Aliagarivorans marinus]